MGMNINDYTKRIRDFAIYPEARTGNVAEITYLILGLTGEAGELANTFKKALRGDGGDEERLTKMQKELGDTLWYLVRLADALDTSVEELAEQNVQKLTGREERGTLHGSGEDR